ncbi:MAG TPA: GNAT family N-acetyltransferase [Chitinolyticbacter sp.]|nr:GNAT family N-acetyltransferase [Chitinolyticbacter sp.]
MTYTPPLQAELEGFFLEMQVSRGCSTFSLANLPQDIRQVDATYRESGGGFWLTRVNGAVAGSIGLRVIDPRERIGEIKRYFVLSALQRRGIGGQLMAHAIEFATQAGLQKIRLDTMKNSDSALAIFKKYGFYEIPKYNSNDVAEIFMEKNLNHV